MFSDFKRPVDSIAMRSRINEAAVWLAKQTIDFPGHMPNADIIKDATDRFSTTN
jgi:hypothetical protein